MKRFAFILLCIVFGATLAAAQQAGRPRQVATKPAEPCNERDFIQANDTHVSSLCQNAHWKDVASVAGGTPADTALDNLTSPTAINQSLLPGADNSINLGSASKRWADAEVMTVVAGTSITGPLLIGGSAVGANAEVRSTSGVGTTDFIKFTVGSNGGTEGGRFLHSGGFSVGSTSDPGAGVINVLTGFRIGNAAASGHYLRGNGTNYVDGAIQAGDVPTLNQNTSGTAANLSGTPALPNGTTATTQSQADNSTKLATTAYADTLGATKQATITFGTGVQTALGVNVGSAGAFVVNGGALGSPSSVGTMPATTFNGDVTHSGSAIIISGNISAPTWTTSGVRIKGTPGTLTDTTAATGTTPTAYTDVLGGNTIAATNVNVVFTNYFTQYNKDPVAGTNVTLTNKWALGADSAKFGTSNQLTISNTGVLTAIAPVLGTPTTLVLTNATGLPLSGLASQATNTIVGNATSGSASPTALAIGTCSTAGSALNWTTNTGFGCNTSITAAAAPISGLTGAGTGVLTALAVNTGSAGAFITFNGNAGTPSALVGTNISGTAASLTAGTASAVAASGVTGTTLASNVVATSITSVGILTAHTVSGQLLLTNDGTQGFQIQPTTGTNGAFATYVNTGGTAYIGVDSSTGGSLGGAAYSLVIRPGSGKVVNFLKGDASTVHMSIDNTGNVFMKNLASSSAATTGTLCWTTGTGLVNVDTTVACLSSTRKVKENERPLNNGLRTVMALRPVSYDLKPEFNPMHLGRQVGLVAEDVVKVDPRLVALDDAGDPRGVRYMQLTAVLVKGEQELKTEFDAYTKATNAKIERLENEKTKPVTTRHRSVRRHARAN